MADTRLDPPSYADSLDESARDSDDPRIAMIADEYFRDISAGRKPDREAYLARHPELAEALAPCLDAIDMLRTGLPASNSSRARGAAASALVGETFAQPLGDFKILSEIARGGMGVVYEAMQLSLGRRVALKVLPFAATVDPRHLQRFKIEAQAAALLHHTHIVPIYAIGCERGVHFYAMQLIEGQSLAAVIKQLRDRSGRAAQREQSSNVLASSRTHIDSTSAFGNSPARARSIPLPPQQVTLSTVDVSATVTGGKTVESETYVRRVCTLMAQAADALEHAHQSGVVHRDVKPGNLLIDVAGNLWITDFGLAQLQADNGITRSSDMLGTFRYMSPEQSGSQKAVLDHRTDIYSLGATFYELLSLEPVFDGASHAELLYQILHNEPRKLREWNRAVPQELETIVLKSLSKNPADRYRTAADFSADIQRYLNHQPIQARRPSLFDLVRKWGKRHPSVVAAGILLLLVIMVGALATSCLVGLEQLKTTQALEREKMRAREAEQRFQQAREAVDAMFQISEEELSDKPFDNARKRLLQVALGHYEELSAQRHGDPESQAELAAVQSRIRSILNQLTLMQREMHTRLLASEVVRKELGITPEQQTELTSLLATREQKIHDLFERLSQLDENARRKSVVAMAEEHERILASILSPRQLRRFEQIALQAQGLWAFKDPDVVAALGLSSEQRSKIRDIERESLMSHMRSRASWFAGRKRDEPFPPPSDPPALHQDELMARAIALFEPHQLNRWQELTGPRLDGIEDEFSGPPFPPPRP